MGVYNTRINNFATRLNRVKKDMLELKTAQSIGFNSLRTFRIDGGLKSTSNNNLSVSVTYTSFTQQRPIGSVGVICYDSAGIIFTPRVLLVEMRHADNRKLSFAISVYDTRANYSVRPRVYASSRGSLVMQ